MEREQIVKGFSIEIKEKISLKNWIVRHFVKLSTTTATTKKFITGDAKLY